MKLRELRDEQDVSEHRQRTSRLMKWREMAHEEAAKRAEELASLTAKPYVQSLGYIF